MILIMDEVGFSVNTDLCNVIMMAESN